MKTKIFGFLAVVACLLFAFAGTGFASDATLGTDQQSLLDLAAPVFDAVKNGHGWLAAFLGVMLLVAAARKYTPETWKLGKLMRSDMGGIVLAFLFAFGGAGATVLAAPGAAMSGAVALTAVKVALAAVGGFQVLHKLAQWLVATTWFQTKAPAWLKVVVGMLLGMFGSNAIKKAETAGAEAVAANPASPTELPPAEKF